MECPSRAAIDGGREAGNFELPAHPGLIIQDSCRRWPERDLTANAMDFFVQILGLSFHAVRRILGDPSVR